MHNTTSRTRIWTYFLPAIFALGAAPHTWAADHPASTTPHSRNTPVTYILVISESGYGTVTSADGAIFCVNEEGACSAMYAAGTQVTLTATPAANATFQAWNSAMCLNGKTCNPFTVTMNTNLNPRASFRPNAGWPPPPSGPTCSAADTGLPPLSPNVVQPALPQKCAVPTQPPVTAGVVTVKTATDLQNALNSAVCGQQIVLSENFYSGNFTIPPLACDPANQVSVIGAALAAYPAGTRVPQNAVLPVLTTPNLAAALTVSDGAAYWYIAGLKIQPGPNVSGLYDLVSGSSQTTTPGAWCDHITLDRMLIDGHYLNNNVRGVDLNCTNMAIIDSSLWGFVTSTLNDGQAILYYNAPGPVLISNNYVEAATENMMLGYPPTFPGMIPSDITVTRNHFRKPLWWFTNAPYGGLIVKDLFEIKNAQRVLLDSNIFDTTFGGAQYEAVQFNGGWPQPSAISDITVTNNLIEHAPVAIITGGGSDPATMNQPTRCLFRNILAVDINGSTYSLPGNNQGFPVQMQNTQNETFDHVTIVNLPSSAPYYANGPLFADGAPPTNAALTFTNSIMFGELNADGDYGAPPAVYAQFPPDTNMTYDVWVGDVYPGLHQPPQYPVWPPPGANFTLVTSSETPVPNQPACNVDYFPLAQCWSLDWALVGFVNFAEGNAGTDLAGMALAQTSQFKNAGSDGADLGANITALRAAIAGVE